MKRLAVIDHVAHHLYVEDVSEETLKEYGSEEAYIKDMYTFEGKYSWDWIESSDYCPIGGDFVEIPFDEMAEEQKY